MAGEYTIEDRMMITGCAYHHHKKLMEDMALNDIVIGRRGVCGELILIST